jgi:hypothetical protein
LGVPVRVAAGGSQEIGLRLGTVRKTLIQNVDGDRKQLIICPSYKDMINAFASSYIYKRRPPTAPTKWELTPHKNEAADRVDALGYGLMGFLRVQANHIANNDRRLGEGGVSKWSASRNTSFSGWTAQGNQHDFDVTKL